MDYRIFPPEEIPEATVSLPPSKSMAARTLTMDFIAAGSSAIIDNDGTPACDDTDVLSKILAAGLPHGSTVDAASSGTALRILTALFAANDGCSCRLTGTDSLRSRPVGPLVDALRSLGAEISYAVREGYAPLDIKGKRLTGGDVLIDPSSSSQYVTALMLCAPLMTAGLNIRYSVPTTSASYVRLTAAMMRARGIDVRDESDGVYIAPGMYSTCIARTAEPDWSAASFWYEIAALTAGWVTLPGLRRDSGQPDKASADLFGRLGVTTEFSDEGAELSASPEIFNFLDADMSENPDLVPPLAVTACMAGVPFRFSGVAGLRHKECDRLNALRDELAKAGCLLSIEDYDNVLAWDGSRIPIASLPVFDSHNDHRIAMALAPAAVFLPGIIVRDAECAAKSYPGFWDDLTAAGFRLADPSDPIPEKEEAL